MFDVNRIVSSDSVDVYNMFEIPTYKNVDMMNCCQCNVKAIVNVRVANNFFFYVCFCKCIASGVSSIYSIQSLSNDE